MLTLPSSAMKIMKTVLTTRSYAASNSIDKLISSNNYLQTLETHTENTKSPANAG